MERDPYMPGQPSGTGPPGGPRGIGARGGATGRGGVDRGGDRAGGVEQRITQYVNCIIFMQIHIKLSSVH